MTELSPTVRSRRASRSSPATTTATISGAASTARSALDPPGRRSIEAAHSSRSGWQLTLFRVLGDDQARDLEELGLTAAEAAQSAPDMLRRAAAGDHPQRQSVSSYRSKRGAFETLLIIFSKRRGALFSSIEERGAFPRCSSICFSGLMPESRMWFSQSAALLAGAGRRSRPSSSGWRPRRLLVRPGWAGARLR